ncbi:saccharopine dehydrogenase (NADP+, L-glutamate forming) [Ekhidna lutea]|uniref:Saccharopine dehydrogenase (NADP+, L-glutamate forming) n=1 Tax=Ekhidna lutea TaxID=447679 RepID=A0A239JM47_EKHLU|nr:saccharopine dehydrogenase family protein [Ekhidna lutea]SNT06488.1 saccharopine dehydrogenase (NADP+, L-glutamate forming) [Ekhidna lutea]
MQNILIIGAGKSSTALINYLLDHATEEQWNITIAEKDLKLAESKIKDHPQAKAVPFDVFDEEILTNLVGEHELIISMLPASLHIHVARKCAELKKHFLTASYLTEEIKSLHGQFENAGKLMIMEMGLDPGIDHMSAMKVLDELREKKYELTGFETFTGGLVAEESVGDNPWKYKFTWNPRNVVLAGQGTCKFIQEGRYKYIPYQKLFRRTEAIYIPDHGYFEGYANRDSLSYLDVYNLRGIKTLYRGTLRRPGYCAAWDVFVQLGATDDTYEMENVSNMTHRQFINSFLSYNPKDSIELKLAHYLSLDLDNGIMFKLKWLGMFDDELVGLNQGTPAQILEHILKKKWTLEPHDKDMIVMWHKFNFVADGKPRQIESSMVTMGDDEVNTAMSKTVGLPLAIAAKLILQGKIKLSGVHVPIKKEIYEPVLDELTNTGLVFSEREVEPTFYS